MPGQGRKAKLDNKPVLAQSNGRILVFTYASRRASKLKRPNCRWESSRSANHHNLLPEFLASRVFRTVRLRVSGVYGFCSNTAPSLSLEFNETGSAT